jgi:MSHA biogenesis protein MshQ
MRKFALCLVACVLWAQPVSAQIAWAANGASSSGTTSISVAVPAGISAGDGLVICLASRETPTDPGGSWVKVGQQSGGSGGAGADIGTVISTLYFKEAIGGEAAEVIAISGGTSAVGRMSRYTKTLATWVAPTASKGADNTAGTAWSVTGDIDPVVVGGDVLITCSATNTDLYTHTTHAITLTGITFGTQAEVIETTTALGNDSTQVTSHHFASSGTSSAQPVHTMTASGTAADNPAGATVIGRLREAAAGGCTGGLLLLGAGKCE